jgi:4-hydroxyphenylacetate 3-monooxygenase
MAQSNGAMKRMEELVDTCLGDYNEKGWTTDTWIS